MISYIIIPEIFVSLLSQIWSYKVIKNIKLITGKILREQGIS